MNKYKFQRNILTRINLMKTSFATVFEKNRIFSIIFYKYPIFSFLIFFLSLKILIPFSRLDFDSRHDGYVLAPAIANHLGYTPFRDVFGLYGPVSIWIQSAAIALPVSPALALRYANALFIALIVFFVADLGRISPSNWGINVKLSSASALIWLMSCDVFTGTTMLSWSSTIASLFSTIGLYFVAKCQISSQELNQSMALIFGAISGIFFGLIPFIKINIGIAVLFSFLFYLFFNSLKDYKFKIRMLFSSLSGVLVSIFTIVWILLKDNALDFYIEQSILFPLNASPDAIVDWKTKENIFRMFHDQLIIIFLLICILVVFQKILKRNIRKIEKLVIGSILIFYETFLSIDLMQARKPELEFTLTNISPYINDTFLSLLLVGSVTACVGLVLRESLGFYSIRNFSKDILLAGLGVSLLIQIIPTWDTRHIWWGLPIGVLVLFIQIRRLEIFRKNIFQILLPYFVFIFFLTAIAGYQNLEKPRQTVPGGLIASGMHVPLEQMLVLMDDTDFLRSYLGENEETLFLTWSGYLSVINGDYQSADEFFTVPEIPGIKLSERLNNISSVVVEDAIYSEEINFELNSEGFYLCSSTKNLHLRLYKVQCK